MLVPGLLLAMLLTSCEQSAPPDPKPPRNANSGTDTKPLTFGVYGTEREIRAYQEVVDAYRESNGGGVRLKTWPDHDAMAAAIDSGELPDVFLAPRTDLALLEQKELIQPVDVLLDERGVDFGDGYARDSLQAFSDEARLQCMPYGISPMVIYYNTDLIDFEKILRRGQPAPLPSNPTAWGFEAFSAAADFATRPRRGTRGLYVAPTLQTLAPFIYAGGGVLFDDDEEPTSLALSDGDTQAALERSLELLRNPQVTLTPQQVAQRSPVDWFKRGKVAMIQGFRGLVPELRRAPGLHFDVLPMPTLDQAGTVGDVTGICMSAETASAPSAADLMVHIVSSESVRQVVPAGHLVPANLEVALSDDFLQPQLAPKHSTVFNNAVRAIVFPPLLTTGPELERVAAPSLEEMLNVSVLAPEALDLLTEQIDAASQEVLAPELATESPESD